MLLFFCIRNIVLFIVALSVSVPRSSDASLLLVYFERTACGPQVISEGSNQWLRRRLPAFVDEFNKAIVLLLAPTGQRSGSSIIWLVILRLNDFKRLLLQFLLLLSLLRVLILLHLKQNISCKTLILRSGLRKIGHMWPDHWMVRLCIWFLVLLHSSPLLDSFSVLDKIEFFFSYKFTLCHGACRALPIRRASVTAMNIHPCCSLSNQHRWEASNPSPWADPSP